jgi:signal recognition particle GTPase
MRPRRGMGDIMASKMPGGKKKARRDDTDFTQFKEGGLAQQAAIAISMKEKGIKPKKMASGGLYENIHKKQARIAAGSGEHMRKPGSKGAPTSKQFKRAAKTAKK